MELTAAQWLGFDESHLCLLTGKNAPHRLLPEVAEAFVAMQAAAARDGIDLAIASSYRNFARQLAIWNGKFDGSRPLLDAACQPLDPTRLDEEQKVTAILRWSALPGTSRHHWGSDLDIYSPALLPEGSLLQLEPWEYDDGGYFAPLSRWLHQHMVEFGFYLPFANRPPQAKGMAPAREPWHLSHQATARQITTRLNVHLLRDCIEHQPVAGRQTVLAMLEQIWQGYVLHFAINESKP